MNLGVVVIGRNEGARLKRCLASVTPAEVPVVYVDSGSTDGSVAHARSVGVDVVELDMAVPFTAARARNAGRERLRELAPDLDAVQMLDGDCELDPGWLDAAARTLEGDPGLAVVWGRMRERHPDKSVYNRLCDLEWDTAPGETVWFGGNALVRTAAYDQVGGYDPTVIAGEEPDMAWRLRRHGWRIRCIGSEVAMHDADITRLAQWWRRCERSGYANMGMATRHGWRVQPYNPRAIVGAIAWAFGVPVVIATLAAFVSVWCLALVLLYPIQWWRIARGARKQGRSPRDARLVATFTLLAKWPECQGFVLWVFRRLFRRPSTIIEYKGAESAA